METTAGTAADNMAPTSAPAEGTLRFDSDFLTALQVDPDAGSDGNGSSDAASGESDAGEDVQSSVVTAFEELYDTYQGRKVPLRDIDDALRRLHQEHGGGMKKFRQVIRSQGICLATAQAYGSTAALRWALLVHQKWVVSREKAKAFKYVKKCLIML